MRELTGIDPHVPLPEALLQGAEPLVLRGLVAHWPAVQAALASPQAACTYLRRYWRDATVGTWLGAADIQGRFFYNDDFSGFNFSRGTLPLGEVLEALLREADNPSPPAIYVGSTTVDTCLPGFRSDNPLNLGPRDALVSLWLGNCTRIAAHFDLPDNLACVVAGRRRFTVLPPQAVENLYVGPQEFTPAGQAISLVDFAHPDFTRFPRFAQALRQAEVVELMPGDALFLPSMWWHHVEATEPFNLLVNHWWRDTPAHMDSPATALWHALLTVRDLPAPQREAWRILFDHYVFEADGNTAAHLPEHARGMLAPMSGDAARMLRARLLKALNR